ncbi:ABC transporter permease [Weissella minor]|uniref:ABC transporter permease protein n=1 Tax=Weissella minor TaxID=1620 RepID=A0A0R2JG83_9LACO|nr:ABC transporter permease [Weissella minor]KRN76361.1 ABC transporter permease protein [Weissella minor]
MRKKQLFTVIKQTFKTRIKTVGYWMLVLTPILLLGAMGGIGWLVQATQSQAQPEIGIVQNQTLSQHLKGDQALDAIIKDYPTDQAAKKDLSAEKLDAVLVEKDQKFTLTKRADGQNIDDNSLTASLTQFNTAQRAQQLQVDSKTLDQLLAPPKIDTHVQSQKGVNANGDNVNGANYGVTIVLGILIFTFLSSYVGMIAQEIANEKSSRIMEILLAATSPGVQFFGKIGGIGLLALLHGALYLLCGLVGAIWLPKIPQVKTVLDTLQGVDWTFAGITVAIVLVSILLYMVLTAIVAAMVNDLSQVQQAVAPVTYLSIIGYALTFLVNGQSHNMFLNIMSYVPFFSQTLMPARLGLQYATMGDAWIALGLELVALVLLGTFGLNVYKQNVLTYREGNITKSAILSLKNLFKRH